MLSTGKEEAIYASVSSMLKAKSLFRISSTLEVNTKDNFKVKKKCFCVMWMRILCKVSLDNALLRALPLKCTPLQFDAMPLLNGPPCIF